MENNAKNRELIARMSMESMSFDEMEDAIIYEFSERYKRDPDLFDAVVKELTDIDMIDDNDGEVDNENAGNISPIRINFNRHGWKSRLIHDRDRSWLELLPTGSTPTQKSMFQAVTLLDTSNADVLVELSKWLDDEVMGNLASYDAYVVYRTTCG